MAALAVGSAFARVTLATDSTPAASAQSDQPKKPFVMRPGVVVDPTAGRLYMMNPQGGIDAVEIASGKLLWTTKAAAKPLTSFDDRLVAEAEPSGSQGLPIVFLNREKGNQDGATIELSTPAGVLPTISDSRGSSSVVATRVDSDNLLVSWTVTTQEISGIQHAGPLPERKDSGAGLINLKTRRVTPLTSLQAETTLHRAEPTARPPRLSGTEALYFPPQRAGAFFISISLGPASAGTPVVLKRWSASTGVPMPDVDLGQGYAAWAVSADNQLLLITKFVRGNALGTTDYEWSIYRIDTGTPVAKIRLPQAATPFFLRDSTLTYVSSPNARRAAAGWQRTPLELRALDTGTVNQIWARALRETTNEPALIPRP